MSEQINDQQNVATEPAAEPVAPKKKLTYQEYLEKRKRREKRENSAMLKLFIFSLIAVSLIVIISLLSKYF